MSPSHPAAQARPYAARLGPATSALTWSGRGRAHGVRQRGPAVAQGAVAQILPAEPEQVEGPQRRRAMALQRLEAEGLAAAVHRDDLAVDDRVSERREGVGHRREGADEPVARPQRDLAAAHEGQAAHAVELALEQPALAEVALVGERGEHRLDPVGRGAGHPGGP